MVDLSENNFSAMAESPGGLNPCNYLTGAWKRNLEWRQFGGNFKRLRGTNAIVVIEEYISSVQQNGTRYLKWSFGRGLKPTELRFGYVMKVSFHGQFYSTDFFCFSSILQMEIKRLHPTQLQ
uniref:Uncharacterized protein n=1 Tax=Lotharella globosa TaxID=91324 RepID=A0A6V3IY81_9EUKA